MNLNRLGRAALAMAVCAVLVGPAPATAQDADSLSPIIGEWEHHGFAITVNDDGSSSAVWRIYEWCGEPGVTDPCDRIVNNYLIDGGRADIAFTGGPDDSGAFQGNVTSTTDPSTLDLGAVALMPLGNRMAEIKQGDLDLMLCGTGAADVAPRDELEQCGA